MQRLPCNTVAFEVRLTHGGGIRRMERRHLRETHQFSAVPPYTVSLSVATKQAWEVGRYGSFVRCAKWNDARLSSVCRSDLWFHPIACKFPGHKTRGIQITSQVWHGCLACRDAFVRAGIGIAPHFFQLKRRPESGLDLAISHAHPGLGLGYRPAQCLEIEPLVASSVWWRSFGQW